MTAYKRIEITGKGEASVVQVVERTGRPKPKTGEVRIQVEATSAVFTDLLIRRGLYPPVQTRPGLGLGYDLVGRVEQLGEGVTDLAIGDRVADLTQVGGNANYVCLPAQNLVPVPDELDAAEAETMILSYMTAYQMLTRWAQVKTGHRILIQGATGAVGLALLQLGQVYGLDMVGTASASHLATIRDYGATAIDYRTADLRSQLQQAAGAGFDAVLDGAGAMSPAILLRLVKPGGQLIVYGFTGILRRLNRAEGKAAPLRKLLGSLTLAGRLLQVVGLNRLPHGQSIHFYNIARDRQRHPDWFQADLSRLFELLRTGQVRPKIAHEFPLEAAPQAHMLLDRGGIEGRLVLRVGAAPAG